MSRPEITGPSAWAFSLGQRSLLGVGAVLAWMVLFHLLVNVWLLCVFTSLLVVLGGWLGSQAVLDSNSVVHLERFVTLERVRNSPESELQLEQELRHTVRKITRDFVSSWYRTVSTEPEFEELEKQRQAELAAQKARERQDSPAALLRSLVYLNTKYLGLRTVEQHLRLSFSNVYGLRKMNPYTKELSICLRIPSISPEQQVKPGTRKRKRKEEDDDPDYSPDNDSGSCPVKKNECLLYELYLSKCPAALKHRTDVFYMKPEISSSSDSPLWYSSTPLENTALESILTRILLIKDIYNRRDPLEEEGEEEEEREEEEAKDSKE